LVRDLKEELKEQN
jgi:chromosome segregation ATPase